MKIKCYDKYNDQHLILFFPDDSIDIDTYTSHYCAGKPIINFVIDDEYYKQHPGEYIEDPHPERWSDLTNFQLIK